uniref:Uncharacterized protein n=1 Tax=Vitis vinifera TaxID=29760 RepID=A5AR83_VITVI|nr:hypothetical protein VITISV_037623 [Vitis vinifera]
MKGIHPSIASHRLNVLPTARPVRQRIRRFHPDRQKIIRDEIDKLLEAGFIREVEYLDWLANVVVVPKKKGKWQVCVDYINLNNACPKDSFPLPRIDQIVDSTAGQGILSFLDAFFGYHQIPMAPADEEKTVFITLHGLYCYKVMPFRLMTKIFKPLVDRTMEVYIDDIVIKSKTRGEHALHLQEVFHFLRNYGMKLNPSKCAFGVSAGKFLGFMVSQRGIEVSPDQVKTVMETPPPRSKKELQRLTGKLVTPAQHREPCGEEWWTLQVDGASRFPMSNSEAEYEVILSGLDLVLALSVSRLRVYSDSQLVVRHVQKEYEAKDERMTRYLTKVRDTLQRQDWTKAIIEYLRTGTLPEEPKQAHKTRVQAARFTLIQGAPVQAVLYRPLPQVLRSLRSSAHSQGHYWPTMKKDAAAYVKKCDKCQRHALIPHWGMDIVGPLPAAVAQKKFLLVATDYFSKWVEAEAYASIKDKDLTKFVWKNIIYRFGIPQTIIADNNPQFDSITFQNFCSELNIQNLYSIPCYPQSNGQAEATNKTLITALKKRLEQAKGKWVEELPGVLWAYRTTPGRPTGNTLFALAYGMDAVIPTEIGLPTIRTEAGPNLDWADEVREIASIRMADYQQRVAAHYNRKARPRSFKSGTLVLRKVFENTTETGAGKFQANWEGPYIVSKTSKSRAYHLQKLDRTPLLRPWNVSNVKQYYQ